MDLIAKVKRYGGRLEKFPSDLVDEKEALRCLEQLEKLPMTISILEESMIGKTLNDIRKSEAVMQASPVVCKRCKEVMRHWRAMTIGGGMTAKKADPSSKQAAAAKPASATSSLASAKMKTASPKSKMASSLAAPGKQLANRPSRSHGQASSLHSGQALSILPASSDASAVQFKKPGQRTARTPTDTSALKRRLPSVDEGPPAKKPALDAAMAGKRAPITRPGASDKKSHNDRSRQPTSRPVPAPIEISPPKTTYRPAPPPPIEAVSRRPQTNNPTSVIGARELDIGQRSHDQHAMYSGRRRGAIGTNVPSLMTLSMRVLIDNIESVEDTYLPFHVLEPLLEKASAKQLLRLESFNSQICDDTSALWKRHCIKDLRGAKPKNGESWKDCYTRTLEEKDKHLDSLTKRINKKIDHEALEAAKRATKLTDVKRMPARRSGAASFSSTSSSSGGFQRSAGLASKSGSGSKLMLKTMKMASAARRPTVPTMAMPMRPARR